MASVPYLKKYYLEKVVPELIKSRGYKNIHQVPNLKKIVLNSAFKAEADKGHMADKKLAEKNNYKTKRNQNGEQKNPKKNKRR